MSFRVAFLTVALVSATAAFGEARFSGEQGTRVHLTRLAAGFEHTCAILDDASVQCWGQNNFGQLGDGTTTNRSTPVTVPNLGLAISVTAGQKHTCAILSSGQVSCWGDNTFGQLGNGTTTSSSTPVTISGLSQVKAISAGGGHTCAVRVTGDVWCWGDNRLGQLGNGSIASPLQSSAPIQAHTVNVVSIAAGASFTCALEIGFVYCWGDNSLGELGNNSRTTSATPLPTAPVSGGAGVRAVEVTAGQAFACALLSDSTVSCWGSNASGQLGNGTTTSSNVPVPSTATHAVALAAGSNHACAILVLGTVSCWGADAFGQLGDGGGASFRTLPVVAAGVTGAVEVDGGVFHTCVRTAAGTIRCWGDNSFSEHGDGTTAPAGTDSVLGISGTFLARGVSTGTLFSCARRGNGAAACWGNNDLGQLGNGSTVSFSSDPLAVNGLSNVIAITGGVFHACALDATGNAQCWGDNARGQLGNGTLTSSNTPVPVAGGLRFVAISAGTYHTCGVLTGGIVECWGDNTGGEIGGDPSSSLVPRQVPGIQNAVAIRTGFYFTCALIADGSVQCWGNRNFGQLGDGQGNVGSTLSPVRVVSSEFATALAGAEHHSCLLADSANVYCWGDNVDGDVGNNSTTLASLPQLVQGLSGAAAIAAGGFFTCATRADGGASCWGANSTGELAAADTVDHHTATPVIATFINVPLRGLVPLALLNVTAIATGTPSALDAREHACALLANGTLRCWGDNSAGEIGNGTTTNQPRPAAVNSFTANVDANATLRNNRVAEVTALIVCETGDEAHITLTLMQGGSTSAVQAEAHCDGELVRVPMTVASHGASSFEPGAAIVHVEAIVRSGGTIVDDTHWTRQVQLSSAQ
jgi:alpha-tubulin suppressor-like RCC1 family protein